MKLIELSTKRKSKNTTKYFAKVDDCLFDELIKYSWCKKINKWGYVYAGSRINGKAVLMHRFIMGVTDPKIFIDHKDRDCLNNQIENLRKSDSSTNQKNKKPRGTSKYLGVNYHVYCGMVTPKWRAGINNNGKQIHLGMFTNEIDAAKAYDEAAKKYHGEFANLNFK